MPYMEEEKNEQKPRRVKVLYCRGSVSVKRDGRGVTEVSLKTIFAVEENIMFGKALIWPCWEED